MLAGFESGLFIGIFTIGVLFFGAMVIREAIATIKEDIEENKKEEEDHKKYLASLKGEDIPTNKAGKWTVSQHAKRQFYDYEKEHQKYN